MVDIFHLSDANQKIQLFFSVIVMSDRLVFCHLYRAFGRTLNKLIKVSGVNSTPALPVGQKGGARTAGRQC